LTFSCFVDFWRKPPPLISFGIERHTLAYQRYHPGISLCYSGVSSLQCLRNSASEGARVKEGFVSLHESRDYLADSSRPSLGLARAHLLSHQSSDSDGGISQGATDNQIVCNS
jgi:hypothetical protein